MPCKVCRCLLPMQQGDRAMTDAADAQATRRIRPWIAAILTFVSLGLGLYYARRTRAAVWVAVLSVVIVVALGFGALGYIMVTNSAPAWFVPGEGWTIFDTIGVVVSAIFAVGVWVVAAKRQYVERAGPARLFGYLAIWLLPLFVSLVIAMSLRFTLLQPFRIPSGSMQPTLQVGDHIVANKRVYGYSRYSAAPFETLLPEGRWNARAPERGDIAVYRPVPEPDRDFVSRVVGLPGDRLQMIGGHLQINGVPVEREDLGLIEFVNDAGQSESIQAWRETLPNGVSYTTFDRNADGELDNTRVYVVPGGHFFMMGDDRDNAADSRVPVVVGYVPLENYIGRVDHIIPSGQGRRASDR